MKEGDVIGRCGNSGHTSEPHIHIHHQRQKPAASGPVNFAEGLPLFFAITTDPDARGRTRRRRRQSRR